MNNAGMGLIRKNNTRNRILNIIRTSGRASKMEIKNISRYSMATVLGIVDELAAANLVVYGEKGETKSGRRPTYISINPSGGFFAGVSFNAAEIGVALLDYCGNLHDFESRPLGDDSLSVEDTCERILSAVEALLERNGAVRDKIVGLGVGAPGYVDEENGVSIFYPHIRNWRNVAIKRLFMERFPDLTIHVEQNSNAMSLAYKWLVPDEGHASYIIISVRSGVRMSAIISGNLYKGNSDSAGEIGHIRVSGGTRYCPCGKRGCLDTEISEASIKAKILEGLGVNRFHELFEMAGYDRSNISMDLFIQSVLAGHSDSITLLDEVCDFLGEAIVQLVNTLNPSKVILTMRLCDLGDFFLNRLRQIVSERAVFVAVNNLSIETAAFGREFAAIGAAAIVMEQELSFVDAII